MSRNVVIAAAVVILVLIGGWFLTRPKPSVAPEVSQTTQPSITQSASPAASAAAEAETKNLVTITSSGFSPKEIKITKGDSVIWVNNDTVDHTVNSAPHPAHTAYPPLNLDVLKPGEKKSLKFPDAGTYKYHDHLNPSLFGSVTVQ